MADPSMCEAFCKHEILCVLISVRQNRHGALPSSQVQLHMYQAFGEKTEIQVIPHFFIRYHFCNSNRVFVVNSTKGMIHGFTKMPKLRFGPLHTCYIQVAVPVGMRIKAYSQIVGEGNLPCFDGTRMTACDNKKCPKRSDRWTCSHDSESSKSRLLLLPGNVMFVKVDHSNIHNHFWLYFEGTVEDLRKSFNVIHDWLHHSAWIRPASLLQCVSENSLRLISSRETCCYVKLPLFPTE